MSEELKPCPFCGGEARMSSETHAIGRKTYRTAKCTCRECGVTRSAVLDVCASLDEAESNAADAWNCRVERTCRMEYNEEWSGDELYPTECYNCSECGHMTYDGVPTFCPKCGAKVVDE